MEKNVLSSIPGIEYYPIIALILFFASFAALIIWYFAADRRKLATISASVLEEGDVLASDVKVPTTPQPTIRTS